MDYTILDDDLRSLIEELDIEITGETSTDFITLCPFHPNSDTGAFNISKEIESNPWRCWNSSCGKTGNVLSLIEDIKGFNRIQSLSFIKMFNPQKTLIHKKLKVREYPIVPESILEAYLPPDPIVIDYMYKRGFFKETLDFFSVGTEGRVIIIPCRDENGDLVGFTRRMTFDSRNKYIDKGLPKRFILFNLNNAIKYDSVIITEGPLDAMKIHQAGFPNVVATMMGDLTSFQTDLLRKNFSDIIIFTDSDEAGRELGGYIQEKLQGKKVYWAKIPKGYKDAGEMSGSQIEEAIKGKETALKKLLKRRLDK